MNDPFLLLFTDGWLKNIRIADGQFTADGPFLSAAMEYLDRRFPENETVSFRCLCFQPQNSVAGAVVLIFLLTRRLNFFIQPTHATGAVCPAFCDKVLEIKGAISSVNGQNDPNDQNGPNDQNSLNALNILGDLLVLRDNEHYAQKESTWMNERGRVIFSSSGSTGDPKFISFSAETLLRNAAGCINRWKLTSQSKVLIPVPVNHMYGLGAGFLPAMLAGADICLIAKANVIKLIDRLTNFGPDLTLLTPALCKMLVVLNKRIRTGKCYITAGEPIRKETFGRFGELFGQLINLYGCTEMGAIATTLLDGSVQQGMDGNVFPLEGVLLKVEGFELQVEGSELQIEGSENAVKGVVTEGQLLCRHYAGFEYYLDATGDPKPAYGAADWYHTNDFGACHADGGFQVKGRMDSCFNRLGYLVALQEVEARVEALLPDMAQVVALAYPSDTVTDNTLIAVCESKDKKISDGAAEKVICSKALPRHLSPDEFYIVDELPRLPNGKPDRQNLYKAYAKIYN